MAQKRSILLQEPTQPTVLLDGANSVHFYSGANSILCYSEEDYQRANSVNWGKLFLMSKLSEKSTVLLEQALYFYVLVPANGGQPKQGERQIIIFEKGKTLVYHGLITYLEKRCQCIRRCFMKQLTLHWWALGILHKNKEGFSQKS